MYAPTVCHLDKLGRLKVIRQGSLLRLVNLDRWSNDCFGCHGGPLELQVESVYSKQAASFIELNFLIFRFLCFRSLFCDLGYLMLRKEFKRGGVRETELWLGIRESVLDVDWTCCSTNRQLVNLLFSLLLQLSSTCCYFLRTKIFLDLLGWRQFLRFVLFQLLCAARRF